MLFFFLLLLLTHKMERKRGMVDRGNDDGTTRDEL
jgi:hypothetical protein